MRRWTPARVARLGYLAGRGASMRSVLDDAAVGAGSERALRVAATRWGIVFGQGTLAIAIAAADHQALEHAAALRGMSVSDLASTIMHPRPRGCDSLGKLGQVDAYTRPGA